MAAKLDISRDMVAFNYFPTGQQPKFGCQPHSNLRQWTVFRPDIEEWMMHNMKCPSGIRLRYRPAYSETVGKITKMGSPLSIYHEAEYFVFFKNTRDGVLFKMFWL